MTRIELTVNGEKRSDEVEPRLLLVHYLRDVLGLRAANVGCDTTSCGACTVLLDGKSVKSCTVLAVQASGHEVVTAEGLSAGGQLHPVQAAFRQEHGLQCGFCTPGMVMAAVGESASDRRTGAQRARRQPVPLHGLSQHRPGRAGCGRSASDRQRGQWRAPEPG
jgi:aerobic carbon-monoxide dehydrogenase small subunit